MFNGQAACDNRDVTYLICHVSFQDHVITGSCNFLQGSFSLHVTVLPSLVAVVIALVEYVAYLICHVTSCDQVFRELPDFMRSRLL